MNSIIIKTPYYSVIDLNKEYSCYSAYTDDTNYAVVSDLSEEDLLTFPELDKYRPFEILSSEMFTVMKESNNNDERERKRDAIFHDAFAIDDERASTSLISPAAIAESNYTYNHILDEIRRLPGLQGRRLYQRYVLDLSIEEIANRDGVGISTVYECIRKAKAAIYNVFVTEGVFA